MNAEPQIKKGRKYDQVISGAREVFMREGFEGASVDVIARDAGVSKATLYSYFPDKQQLFLAVLQMECDFQKKASMDIEIQQRSVPDALHHIASSMLEFFLSDAGLSIFRVCVGEAQRFPELGRAFYETGPCTAMAQMAAFMESPKAREVLDIEDAAQAADTFMQLCRTDLMLQRLMGVAPVPTPEQIDKVAGEAVKTFMARYARR
ncbi:MULTISPECIES: TetR/AcrR family transcriptional regulator [Paracoccaceae]|jgi:AcrR family transcriptional regulator|uniref:TetR/AcrR family transcriptional regulator n=1 Tax=Rhodophyticola porphyridii TaxID=1852017 RepID=A0A3L9Y6N9_9RHOB|nr:MULTISPECIES: TetR/AcrR family transcriptional regulator [Paracoccaceae]MBO6601660.1 TetR/AcrR family transcriptional regulator [Roseicyclus sp.]MBO6624166.1 TetR/AcrR family transcriptional regulator [Roseicyclus sp.]MBO6920828.1 TetR/AcrR family transcriptional regulator [Roseicyclus sp.]RMA42747.1 TetR/AcrR family transcriptional regulator [Rhodophyticola porphyridii]